MELEPGRRIFESGMRMHHFLRGPFAPVGKGFFSTRSTSKGISEAARMLSCGGLDPPYWRTEGYGVPFGLEEYEVSMIVEKASLVIADALRRLKGKAILSINDHPDMRRVFDGFRTKTVGISYSVNNRSGGGAEARELIVRSG
jgi:hypothetical protein